MKFSVVYFFVITIFFASCKGPQYSITEIKSDEGKSGEAFIDGALTAGLNAIDTILYYRFYLLTDSVVFKESPGLNIGIKYSRTKQDSSYSINLAFRQTEKDLKTDTLQIIYSDNKKTFTNLTSQNTGKGTETTTAFVIDKYLNPITSAQFVNEECKLPLNSSQLKV